MFVAVKKKKSYGWIWWIHIFVLRLCQPQITSFSFSIFWQWDFVFRSTSGRANYNNWEQFLLILLGSTILLLEIEDSIYCRWVFWFWKNWFAIPSWYWQFSAALPMTANWMFSRHDQLLHSLLLVGESQLVPLPPGNYSQFVSNYLDSQLWKIFAILFRQAFLDHGYDTLEICKQVNFHLFTSSDPPLCLWPQTSWKCFLINHHDILGLYPDPTGGPGLLGSGRGGGEEEAASRRQGARHPGSHPGFHPHICFQSIGIKDACSTVDTSLLVY